MSYFSKRYLRYETNANNNFLDYGEVVRVINDRIVNINMSGSGYILESVNVDSNYIPKIGDWISIEWINGQPLAKYGGGMATGLTNVNDDVKIVVPSDMAVGIVNADHIRTDTIEARHISAYAIEAQHISANSINAIHISANTIESRHISANSINATHIGASVINAEHISANSIKSQHISANAIQAQHISANAINAEHISANSINTNHISANSIGAVHIVSDAIQALHISANAIQSEHVSANAINAQHISANAVQAEHISANSVNATHVSANSIQSQHISASSIGANHIITDTIESGHIKANAIESQHISANSILATHISTETIQAHHMSANSIESQHISANTIDSVHVKANSIKALHISANQVNAEHISANTISSGHIISDTVDSRHIKTNSVQANHISANNINGAHIIAQTIQTQHISANAVQTQHISANSIQTSHISANSVVAGHIVANAIRTAHISANSIIGEHISANTIDAQHVKADAITATHLSADSVRSEHISANVIRANHISANSISTEHIVSNAITSALISANTILSEHINSAVIKSEHISANVIVGAHISAGVVQGIHVESDTIQARHMSANSVEAEQINTNAIIARHVSANAIQSAHVSANTILAQHIIAGEIKSTHISANSIQTAHVSANTIQSSHIKAEQVNATHISANSVRVQHVSANTIQSSHISANVVQSQHISANTIQTPHISANTIESGHIKVGQVNATHVSANTIQTQHISANAVQSKHVSANTVQSQHVSANTIQTAHISANTIESSQIKADQIKSNHISANVIQAKHMSANSIQANHISANSVQAQHISANSVQSQHISANSVTSTHLSANSILSQHIEAGSIDTDHLSVGTKKEGLIAQYYTYNVANGSNKFQVFKGTQIDPTINFNWGTGSPSIVGQSDNFSVRWQGFILAPETGTYDFLIIADDSMKVSVNNTVVVDQPTYASLVEQGGSIQLEKDRWYPILVEMSEVSSSSRAELRWRTPSLVKEIVPSKYFTQGNTIVDGATIVTGTITATNIKTGTITAQSGIIADFAIQTAHIATGSITSAKIGTAEIKTVNIADGNIENIHIKDATISHAKIISVDASTITVGKLIGNQISASVITGAHISGATITGDKIKALTLDAGHIQAGAITALKISTNSIETRHLGAEVITADKISVGSIESYHISTVGLDAESVSVYSSATGETLIGGGYLRIGGLDAGVVQSDNLVNNGLFLVSSSDWGLARSNESGETILGMQNDAPGGSTVWKYSMLSNPPTLLNDNIIAGKKPGAIIINATGQIAYVANQGENTVSKIDLINDVEISTLSVGQEPIIIKFTNDQQYILVANSDLGNKKEPDSITVIDANTFLVHKTITVGSSPFDIALSDDGNTAYVSCSYPNDIYIVDLGSLKVTGAIAIGDNTFPLGLELSADNTKLYTCNSVDDSVSVVDIATGLTEVRIPVGDAPVQSKIYGGKLYISCGGSNSISVIDLATNLVINTIAVGVKPTSMVINPYVGTGGYLFVACGGTNTIVTIDMAMGIAIGYFFTGANPIGLVFYPDYSSMYVTNNGDSAILSFVYPDGDYIGDAYISSDGQSRYHGADGWTPNRSDWFKDISGNILGASTVEFKIGEPLYNEAGYARLMALGAVDQLASIEQDIASVTNFSNGNNVAQAVNERLRPKDILSTSGNTEYYPVSDWVTVPSDPLIYFSSGGVIEPVSNTEYTIQASPSKVIFNSVVPSGNYVLADYSFKDNVWFKDHNASVKAFNEQPSSPNYFMSFEVDEMVPKFVIVDEVQTRPFTPTADGIDEVYEGLVLSATKNQALNLPSAGLSSSSTYTYGDSSATDISRVVNGNISSSEYYTGGIGSQYVQLDLTDTYMVDNIKVWHFYSDARTYNATKTQVSLDGIEWTTIFDSALQGTYVETSAGKTHSLGGATPVRFIRDYLNGNTVNTTNHWVDIQVFGDWKLEVGEIISTPYGPMPKYTASILAKNPNANSTLITTNVSKAYLEYDINIEFLSDWYINYVTGTEFGLAKVLLDGISLLQNDGKTNFYLYQNSNIDEYMYYQGIKLKKGLHKIRIEQTTGTINFDRLRFDDFQRYSKTSLPLNNTNTNWERYKITPEDAKFYIGTGRQSTAGPFDKVRINPSTGLPDGSVPLKYRVKTIGELVGDGTNQRGISYVTGLILEEGKLHTHWRKSQAVEKIASEMIEEWDVNKPHSTGIQAKHLSDGLIHGSKILSNSLMDYHISPYAKIAEFKLDLNYDTHGHENKSVLDSIIGFTASGTNLGVLSTISRGDHNHNDIYPRLSESNTMLGKMILDSQIYDNHLVLRRNIFEGDFGLSITPSDSGSINFIARTATNKYSFDKTIDVTGNLTLTGTVDGVDIASLKTSYDAHVAKPLPASNLVLSEVGEVVEVSFNIPPSTDIEEYEIWSSVGNTSSYELVSRISASDIVLGSTSISVEGVRYDRKAVIYYKILIVKSGVKSDALNGNITLTRNVLDPTNMEVISDVDSFTIQCELPVDKMLLRIEIYADVNAVLGALNETNSVLIYSGMSDSYTYSIPEADFDKYHQFWIKSITRS